MKIRALEFDLARTQRPSFERLKYLVDNLADLGFNMMTVNLEHRFAFPSAPGLAPPGALTPEVARSLCSYGRRRGVEIVPQPNLIGHCEGLGATERYARLCADPFQQGPWGGYEQLNLELSEGRALARAMLEDVLSAFPGEYVHIGGDEVRRMEYLFPGDPDRRVPAMLEQFEFVLDLARRSGRKVMMWGDMPLHHEPLMKALPRDVIICHWNYGPEDPRETLLRYKREGFRVLASPSTNTHPFFCSKPDAAAANIQGMVAGARELELEGFLLTQWEAGFGSSFDLCWPWIAFAAEVAEGRAPRPQAEFLADFASQRYETDGTAFARLHALLGPEFEAALACSGAQPRRALVTLRKALFRGADPVPDLARPAGIPSNPHQQVWEPSPFHAWLYLRPILNDEMLRRLDAIAKETRDLLPRLVGRPPSADNVCDAHARELTGLTCIARAYGVLVERLHRLNAAKACYHRAALAQGEDTAAFQKAIAEAADELEKVRPGIIELRRIVEKIDAITGLDHGELDWLRIHERSLDEHLAALRRKRPEDDALLEFGEFLRRPAQITPRLTWR